MRAIRPRREHSALYGITAERVAEICRVHVTTARRWKRYGDVPYAAEKLIELVVTGDLGLIDPNWSRWRIVEGKLVSPDDLRFNSGDILAIPFTNQLVASYQRDQRLPRQADWVDEKWYPAPEAVVA